MISCPSGYSLLTSDVNRTIHCGGPDQTESLPDHSIEYCSNENHCIHHNIADLICVIIKILMI